MADVRLIFFDGSNACRTATEMLAHKGIDYEPVRVAPGVHVAYLKLRRFPGTTVPAMTIDGRRVQGTRAISRALDELSPDRPLFPADPVLRAKVEEAERWGEECADAIRRVFYCAARRDPGGFDSLIISHWSGPSRVALKAARAVIVRAASLKHKAADEAGRADLAELPERLDRIEAWLEEGVIGGEQLNAADFQIAVNARALLMVDDVAQLVEGRPVAAYARRVIPEYTGHVRAVLPDEWLDPLRAAG